MGGGSMFFDLNCLAEKGSAPNLISEMKPPLLRLVEAPSVSSSPLGVSRTPESAPMANPLASAPFSSTPHPKPRKRSASASPPPSISSPLSASSPAWKPQFRGPYPAPSSSSSPARISASPGPSASSADASPAYSECRRASSPPTPAACTAIASRPSDCTGDRPAKTPPPT
nr:hypothetical protein Iba_scaffold41845CG0020 [Ipomoea batatas]